MMAVPPANILVVDDEPQICSTISRHLAAHGSHCQTASDPRSAKALLTDSQFDVLIADIAMDAMLMARSYKDAYPVERMLDELRLCAGTQFDPQIAAAAVEWCNTNPNELILSRQPVKSETLTSIAG